MGGNDCTARTDPEPVAELLQQYKTMAAEANRLADDVRVATVIPRIPHADDDPDFSERIDAFNAGLVSMCQDNDDNMLINNDDYFKLRDGDINDGYILQDGTHLTKNGINKLAKSLQLRTIPTVNSDVTKSDKKRGYSDALKKPPSASRRVGTQAHTQALWRVPCRTKRAQIARRAAQHTLSESGNSPQGGRLVRAGTGTSDMSVWMMRTMGDNDPLTSNHVQTSEHKSYQDVLIATRLITCLILAVIKRKWHVLNVGVVVTKRSIVSR